MMYAASGSGTAPQTNESSGAFGTLLGDPFAPGPLIKSGPAAPHRTAPHRTGVGIPI